MEKRIYPKQTESVKKAKIFLKLVKEGNIIWVKPEINNKKYTKYE